jgi:cytochrome c1
VAFGRKVPETRHFSRVAADALAVLVPSAEVHLAVREHVRPLAHDDPVAAGPGKVMMDAQNDAVGSVTDPPYVRSVESVAAAVKLDGQSTQLAVVGVKLEHEAVASAARADVSDLQVDRRAGLGPGGPRRDRSGTGLRAGEARGVIARGGERRELGERGPPLGHRA